MVGDRSVARYEVHRVPQRCVAVGGSAGSIEVLRDLLAALPHDLPAPVLAVVHLPADSPSRLADVLGRRSRLPVQVAVDGDRVEDGRVYVARPDHHLTLADGRLEVRRGPRHNLHRPAIDPLFWSVGRSVDGGTVGVILSGAPGDGVAGSRELALLGGVVLVQDPSDALFPAMPTRILERVPSARAVALDDLPAAIVAALDQRTSGNGGPTNGGARLDPAATTADAGEGAAGEHLRFGCPACGGVLEGMGSVDPLSFRCRVGHAYDADGLLRAQAVDLEDALWAAVRGLEEQADLAGRVAEHQSRRAGQDRYRTHAEDTRRQAATIRTFLVGLPSSPMTAEVSDGS